MKANWVAAVAVWLAAGSCIWAQSVTGQISGTVTDAADSVIAGAKVELTNDLTRQVRTRTTESSGSFIFADLVPGDYSLLVVHPGFKSYSQHPISVSADEKVALHDIKLRVGEVTTTISVEAETAHVATDSSDRSILVNSTQIANTPVRGRDWLGVLETLPGVVDLNNHDVPGWNSGMPTINGGQTGQVFITMDGVGSQDSGAPANNGYLAPSVDAIGEVKVMVSNYSAEYGSRGGGQLVVTVKNGTSRFHGSAYYFYRHESLNANEFFNNAARLQRPLYRYSNEGGTIGGPPLVPGTTFNKSRTKLFFFFSEDYLSFLTPGTLNKYTMPSALERQGDFSQTDTTTAKLITVKDPTTGKAFPGNIIPVSRISPIGAVIMNLFPLPFTTDPTGQRQYNAIYQFSRHDPREDRILRLDYNVARATQAFVRLMNDYQADRGIGSTLNSTGGWGQMPTDYGIQSAGAVLTVIHTFRANLINEFTAGINRAHQGVSVENQTSLAANQLGALNLTLPKIYSSNEFGLMTNLIPNIRFTTLNPQAAGQGVTNPPAFTFDARFPFNGTDQVETTTDTLSWIRGDHSVKFGFYYERMARNVSVYSEHNTNGSYYFGSDTASPYDTGYAYSNLILGSVQAYGEDSTRLTNHARYNQIEWFAQDSWKAARRLTFDIGVRFQYPGALTSAGTTLGLFNAADYNAAQSGTLLYPAVVNGQNVAENLTTGATYPLARAGFFDPASYAAGVSPYSGMVEYKSQAFLNPGLAIGPRVGFGWDVFGDGKTALRGGFGIFYDRAFGVDTDGATSAGVGPIAAPPAFQSPVYYNANFSQLLSAQGFLSPQTVFAGQSYKNPSTYNWSIGVQRDLGKTLILDIAYVGNAAHNRFVQVDGNGVMPYTDWTPSGGANKAYIDPTSGGKQFYTTNLMRPYTGYGAIDHSCSCADSNYHSLQTQVNRRFGKRLQFGANWTWSKTLSYGTRSPWTPDYLQYAEVSSDRQQVVNANYSYQIPDGSRIWKNKFTQLTLDGWHFNGVTKLMSGTPLTVTCTATAPPIGEWTGTPTGGIPFRCEMLNPNPFLASTGGRTLYYPLNKANFSLPPANSLGIGNTPTTMFLGPGFENFDFSMLKDVRIDGEGKRILEFRVEAYNVLNHFNPGNPNTSLTLNYTSGANTNANFGSITTAIGQARHVALAAKFRF